jgi:hypothetical protein
VNGSYELDNEDYHSDPCVIPSLSRGTIVTLLTRCPYQAWYEHPKLNPNWKPKPDKKVFDIGSFVHPLLLEGINKACVIDADDWRTKTAREQRDEARLLGKIPLLQKEYDEVLPMVEAAKRQLAESELGITDLRSEGDSERSYFWQENATFCRSRVDWIKKDKSLVIDLKTSRQSVNPEYVQRKIINEGLDIQDAFYTRGVEVVDGILPLFVFMMIETTPPYLCSFVSLTPQFFHLGKQKVSHGIGLWEQCMSENRWPAYPKRICYVDMPGWADNWTFSATLVGSEEGEI